MVIEMDDTMAENLSELLNRKRGEKIAALRRSYSIKEMADEIGIDDSTLQSLLRFSDEERGLQPKQFKALHKAFGDEFLRAMDLDPDAEPTFKLEETKKATRG